MPGVNLTAAKGLSSVLRLLCILLYEDNLQDVERYSNGLVILKPSSFCKADAFGSNSSYLRLYLTILNEIGLIKRLSIKRGKIRFYINRPPIFRYADNQSIPEGVDNLTDGQLANYAHGRAAFVPEETKTNEDIFALLKEVKEKLG